MIAAVTIQGPTVEYSLLSPVLAITVAAVLGVLVETVVPRAQRFGAQVATALGGIGIALVLTIWVYAILDEVPGKVTGRGGPVAMGALSVDGPGVLTWGMLLVFALLGTALMAERELEGGLSLFTGRAGDAPGSRAEAQATTMRVEHTEVLPLAMFALLGMMLFATSNDLLTMFVALEVLSLPLYVLCAMARRRRLISQEAALKYFLLGAFSSVFFLYGAAMAYGYAGSVELGAIAQAVSAGTSDERLLFAAIGLLLVGLLFKVGAVPFHSWTPDVYQGAPTPVTAFMAAGTKAAALVATLRVLFVAFGGASWDWRPIIWVVAAVTMVFGSLVAIAQTDVKRMLGYSSVANAGFLLLAAAGSYAGGDRVTSVASALFYLTSYGLATIGAFAVVMLVRDPSGESTQLSQWAGLGRSQPLLAAAFALFMLSFAGIPLTAGFIGKWTVFSAAWSGGFGSLVVVAVIASAIAAFFYVRMIVLMYFSDPAEVAGDGPGFVSVGRVTTVVVVVAAIGTVILGIVPGPALELAQHAGAFVR